MPTVNVSKEQARSFLIRRQGFLRSGDAPPAGSAGVLTTLSNLQAVQIDPICAFERNHHQVLYNRVPGYRPEWLDDLLYQERGAFEYYCNALCLLPMADFPYFAPQMLARRQRSPEGRIDAEMQQAMQELLVQIGERGAVSSRDFPSGKKVSGWWDNAPHTKIEKQAMDYLHMQGELLIARREGNQRSYDLASRMVPEHLYRQTVDEAAARRYMLRKFLRAYGLSEARLQRFGWYPGAKADQMVVFRELLQQGEVTSVAIDGLETTYFCLTELLPELLSSCPPERGEAAVILAPLDNLLWDRDRLEDLWDFRYRWEVYTPAAQRCYGYYVVPVLYGDSLVGRIELSADRKRGELQLVNLWLQPGEEAARPAIRRAVELEAEYLGLARVTEQI